MTHAIIIDTDPGIDDAFAIALAHYSPAIEILGLTTVFGNVSVAQSTDNAAALNALLGSDYPIAAGCGLPLQQAPNDFPDFVHGHNGFGDVDYTVPPYTAQPVDAADFIIETLRARPGEVTLVPIGPLSNIAMALHREPRVAQWAKGVVLMGGAGTVGGNVSPVAEANIWNDAAAAQKVFEASWEIVMVGLDVTHRVVMPRTAAQALAESSPKVGGFLAEISDFYANFYESTRGFAGFCVHDPTAIAYIIDPSLFGTRRGLVEVTTSGPGIGQTIFAETGKEEYPDPIWASRSNVSLCTEVQGDDILELIQSTLGAAP